MKQRVSVVIPTIEEEAIFKIINDIRKLLGRDTEIIVVDKSGEKYYQRLKKTGVKVIRQRDRGVEKALMMGLREARGEILASIDADGTHDTSSLIDGVRMVESGEADLVLGNRLAGLQKGSMGFYLKFGNAALSYIFSKLYKTKVHDVLTGLFVMNRRAFNDIKNREPYRAGIAFFAIELGKRAYRIKEVDTKYYIRSEGESKLTRSKFAYGFGVATYLVRQIRDYSPLLIFGALGTGLIVLGFLIGLMVLVNFLQTGLLNEVGRALIAFMLVTLGVLSIIAGFIIDLLLEIERILEKE